MNNIYKIAFDRKAESVGAFPRNVGTCADFNKSHMKTNTLFLIACLLILLSPSAYSFDVRQWETDFWTEMRSGNVPWVWALSLHNLSGSLKDVDQTKEQVRVVIDKLLAHPSPGAESLYWAALICVGSERLEDVCRVPELVKRLMEIDGDNVYAYAIYYDTELSDKSGLNKVSDELLDWSYFDTWLERAVTLNRAESYDSIHYAEFAKILEEYAQTESVPSYLKGAPLEWKVAFYMSEEHIFPWYGSMGKVSWHCRVGMDYGHKKTTEFCRTLSNRLLDSSKSIVSRGDALFMLGQTYSKKEPEFLRFSREAIAWSEIIESCLNQIWKLSKQQWSITYDAWMFVEDFESRGEISALQSLAESEGWGYQDNAGNKYQCMEALEMDDDGLIQFLGRDPAWMWCGNGELCDLPIPMDPLKQTP